VTQFKKFRPFVIKNTQNTPPFADMLVVVFGLVLCKNHQQV
jgi:hypothetical protein